MITGETEFLVNWEEFTDSGSAVDRYYVGLGSAPGMADITSGFQDVGMGQSATLVTAKAKQGQAISEHVHNRTTSDDSRG